MSQGVLCPNLSQKVQKEVSQMAQSQFAMRDAIRWFKCKLKPPKNRGSFKLFSYDIDLCLIQLLGSHVE